MDSHPPADIAESVKHQRRITIAFLVMAWFFVLLRLWTRTFIISSFGWDDGTMLLAGMMFTVYCATTLFIDAHGGGTVITSFDQLKLLTKCMTIAETSYVMTMMIVKISLAIFFARIVIKPWHVNLIKLALCISITSSVSAFFYSIFRCGPNLDDYAMRQILQQCSNLPLDLFMAYQQAAFNTLTDLIFIAMPVLVLWNSQMKLRTKIPICAILLIATLGTICSMIRFKYVSGILKTSDFFWHAVNISLWSTAEAGSCIMAGCTATLRPLLKIIIDRTQMLTPSSSYKSAVSSFVKNCHRSKRHSMRIARLSESDLLYSAADDKRVGSQITTQPAYIELVAQPPAAHVAPPSRAIGKSARASMYCPHVQQQLRSKPSSSSLP